MGLFSTVLHVYRKTQDEVLKAFFEELEEVYKLNKLSKIDVKDSADEKALINITSSEPGIYYLITQPHGDWITIVELNVNVAEDIFYLYEVTNNLSKRLETYALSFHLHDGDLLFYNLEKNGKPVDGYSSDYQYFLPKVPDNEEIISQRHESKFFINLLPPSKDEDTLNAILNEGYWNAFDEGDLNEDGVPNDDKYYVDEEDRLIRLGTYLEIFNATEYPFANWYINLDKLNLSHCYLLKAEKVPDVKKQKLFSKAI